MARFASREGQSASPPQTSGESEPLQPNPRDRPSRWALALFWSSVAFTGMALALLASSFLR